MSNVIDVQSVCYEYPGKKALDNVSFSLEGEKITALVGPNGAGKTTLFRCIAALDYPLTGRVLIRSLDTTLYPRDCHAQIGYLSDHFGLYDKLTVLQCLTHAASVRGLRGDAHKAALDWIIDALELRALLTQKAGTLSRGQRQRIGIAQVTVHKPKLLILDEPASGLDPESRHQLSKLLLKLRDDGMSIIVSSHILSELEDYSDDMITLSTGKIIGHVPIKQTLGIDTKRIRISVNSNQEMLARFLVSYQGVSDIEKQDDGVILKFAGSRADQTALLKSVVNAGIAVYSFVEEKVSMQSVYLSQIKDKG